MIKINSYKDKDSRITIFTLHPKMKSEKIETFLKVHEVKRSELMELHSTYGQEYLMLHKYQSLILINKLNAIPT